MKIKNFPLSSGLIVACLMTLASCGSDSGSSGSSSSRQEQRQKEQDDQGIYRVVLKPLNTSLAGETTGTMEIRIEGDDVSVSSTIAGAPVGVKHLQNIMLGTSCPVASSDTNGDTVVDIKEAMALTGDILIPLDSKISDQIAGIDYGPIANGAGSYVYRRSASLTDILADLRSPDPDKFDSIVKLPFGQRLNLAGKVVLIHGVNSGTDFAETVSTIRDLSHAQSLPIACGKIVRVNSEDPTPEDNTPTVETESSEEETSSETSDEDTPASTDTDPEVTL